MGTEHLPAVWEHSRQSGSGLIVLLAVASHSDHNGEWVIDRGGHSPAESGAGRTVVEDSRRCRAAP
jgi:hypothetical protein